MTAAAIRIQVDRLFMVFERDQLLAVFLLFAWSMIKDKYLRTGFTQVRDDNKTMKKPVIHLP